MAPQQRTWAVAMLVGATALLVMAVALTLLGPAVELRFLRRKAAGEVPAGARIRFAALCEAHGLTGRRRPRPLMAPAGYREAFTTGAIHGPAYVVVPAGVAFRSADPTVFDAIIHHELAHVAARDTAWVSAVRWANRLTVPALGVVCLAAVLIGGGVGDATVAVATQGLLLSGATALLVASLLRQRERAADRVAAAHLGNATAMAEALDGGVFALRPPRRGPGRVADLVALHPARASRAAALRHSPVLDGGFGASAAVAFVGTFICLQGTELLDWLLSGPSYNRHRMIAATAGGWLIATCLVPMLAARSRAARAAGRAVHWAPVTAGTTAGTTLGALLTPTGAGGQLALLYLSPVVLALLIAAGAAVGTLCAGWAALVPRRRDPRPRLLRSGLAVAAATAATGTVLATTMEIISLLVGPRAADGLSPAGGPTQTARDTLEAMAGFGFSYPYAGPAVAFLISLALLGTAGLAPRGVDGTRTTASSVSRSRRAAVVPAAVVPTALVLAAALPAAAAAAVTAHQRLPLPPGLEVAHLNEQRWWACIAAGLVTSAAVLRSRRRADPRTLVHAAALGWAAAALAAIIQYLRDAVTDGHWHIDRLNLHLTPVTWRFFLLTVALAAVWIPITKIIKPPRARVPAVTVPVPRRNSVTRHLAHPLGTASVALVLALVVVVADAPWLYVTNDRDSARIDDALHSIRNEGDPPTAPRPAQAGQAPRRDPGRALTQAETDRMVRSASAALSPAWGTATRPDDPAVRVEPARCQPLATDYDQNPSLGPPRATSQVVHPMRPEVIPGGPTANLGAVVHSFDRPLGTALLSTERDVYARCPRVTLIAGDGDPLPVTVHAERPGTIPQPLTLRTGQEALTTTVTASLPLPARPGTTIELRQTHVTVRSGHTLVIAWTNTTYIGNPPPAPLTPPTLSRALTTALTAMLDTLTTIPARDR